jgi:CubicO group peptidase (beta-lactamase class C family)
VDARQFMGVVLVARGDAVIFSKAYGAANLEWEVPNTTNTRFRLGSITKQFTAACILLLEERGKLRLQDPIKQYLPDVPDAWSAITVYQLLTHTGGIMNFTGLPDFDNLQRKSYSPEQLIALFRDRPLVFPPGSGWGYSNSGYIVLGAIIEKVSGQTYEQFLRENIFTPLGMSDSGYDSNSAIIPRRAAGYAMGSNGLVNAGYIHMSVPFAAGALYSTTEDLLRWEQGLFGNKLLSAESTRRMITPEQRNYAFGLMIMTYRGRPVIQHGGLIDGFSAMLTYYPQDQITVIALSNIETSKSGWIVGLLGALAHGDTVTLPSEWQEVSVPLDVLKKYVGTYQANADESFIVTLEGRQLRVQYPGRPAVPLIPGSRTVFLAKDIDAEIEFSRDQMLLHRSNHDLRARRAH